MLNGLLNRLVPPWRRGDHNVASWFPLLSIPGCLSPIAQYLLLRIDLGIHHKLFMSYKNVHQTRHSRSFFWDEWVKWNVSFDFVITTWPVWIGFIFFLLTFLSRLIFYTNQWILVFFWWVSYCLCKLYNPINHLIPHQQKEHTSQMIQVALGKQQLLYHFWVIIQMTLEPFKWRRFVIID